MGKLKVLWQSVKLLLRIYNMSQPSNSLELMTQILELFQDIMQLLNTLKETDLCRDIYWELGVFKQKMFNLIDHLKRGLQHIDFKITYFGKYQPPPLAASPVSLAASPDGQETPPLELAGSPDIPGAGNLAPHCLVSRKLAEEQGLGTCEEVDSCGECQNLRQQLQLAEKLCFVAGEIQNIVAQTPSYGLNFTN
ncbi:agnoprotein [Rhinolophus thomasi polyomavirus 2]|nr:agnoprotein [Rhinolophus thomasi polyomavirus 2]